MTFQRATQEGLISAEEIRLTIVVLAFLLAWPWVALRLGARQTGPRASSLLLIPVLAALSTTVLLLLLGFGRWESELPRGEILRIGMILGYSSCAAGVGSCLFTLGLAAEGLPRRLRFPVMLALSGGYLFGTGRIALVPFGQSSDGWYVFPNPFVGGIPLLAAFLVPTILWRRRRPSSTA